MENGPQLLPHAASEPSVSAFDRSRKLEFDCGHGDRRSRRLRREERETTKADLQFRERVRRLINLS